MRAASKTKDVKSGSRDGAVPAARALDFHMADLLDDYAAARQQLLDALPIAAAVVGRRDKTIAVECSNPIFAHYESAGDSGSRTRNIFARNALGRQVAAFLDGAGDTAEFCWTDGGPIEGRHFTVKLTRIVATKEAGQRCMLFLLDNTAQLQTERNLKREMLSDSLTGLPNRAGFTEILEQAAAQDDAHFAVLAVDLVRFSRINECIGTMAGDELIITVARRLVKALRGGDHLARTGGDEFGILVRLVDGPGDALHVANRIREVLAAPFRLSELEICVDCSIGCALLSDEAGDVEKLIRHAQFALKRAKDTRRVEVYQPTAFHMARKRFSLETELRRAVENDELHLAFQPLVDLATDRVAGFEALARWDHPELGVISPQEFIPVAEESGLIVPIGRWALGAAAQTIADWDRRSDKATAIRISVNLSAIQLARDDIPAAVTKALAAAGIAGNRFTLELTESAVIADPERVVRVLDELKALDTALAMDDFGTGYSSLAYLQRLPLDILKIDRSFITGMLTDRNKIAIVRAVLSLAHALGMKTTAEGIESLELAQTLAALGCATGQGFHYSGPLDADQAYAFLTSRNV